MLGLKSHGPESLKRTKHSDQLGIVLNNDVSVAVSSGKTSWYFCLCSEFFSLKIGNGLCVSEQLQALQCILSPTVFTMPFHPQTSDAQL